MHPIVNDNASSGCGRLIPPDSTMDALVSLGLTQKFIDSWLKSFKKNYLQRTMMHGKKMSELFKKIPVTIPERNPDE